MGSGTSQPEPWAFTEAEPEPYDQWPDAQATTSSVCRFSI